MVRGGRMISKQYQIKFDTYKKDSNIGERR